MKIFRLKARTEFEGNISGDVYVFIEDNIRYYYLVNILNSSDIRVIKTPNREKVLQELSIEDVDEMLRAFHEERVNVEKTGKKVNTEQVKKAMEVTARQNEVKARDARRDEIWPYFVYDMAATEYLLSRLGKTYLKEQVKEVYSRIGKTVYEINGSLKFTIVQTRREGTKYYLVDIQEDKKEYEAKMKRLMDASGVPRNICKIYINMFEESEVLKILRIIQADRSSREWWNSSAYVYFWHLHNETRNFKVTAINENKQHEIFAYVSGES